MQYKLIKALGILGCEQRPSRRESDAAWVRRATYSVVTAVLLVALLLLHPGQPAAASDVGAARGASADELLGLWKAKRRFGPDAHGPLIIQRTPSGWSADFLGGTYPVRAQGAELSFALANGEGSFQGRLGRDGHSIAGHWTSPRSPVNGFFFAVPVILNADGANRLRGSVAPLDDNFTIYLMVQKRSDGTVGAFLRNPERNIGVLYPIDHLIRDGNLVNLVGKRQGQTQESLLLSGTYYPDTKVLSAVIPNEGGTYDFQRDDEEYSDFYTRGKNPDRYLYRAPLSRDDGWPTGTLDEANIDRVGIEKFIQMLIDSPIDSVATPEVHGILIARHGKLVLEEYFHGEHRDKMHDTRSAAKSLTATIVGAAMQAGAPLKLSTPVYQIMNGGTFPTDLEPCKRAMTLEHLLMMRSGYFCDDSNPDAPGNEDNMNNESDDGDYYRYTLKVPMAMAPGEKSIYCSASPNLALGMVGRATGESVMDTFDRLIGAPMKIDRYSWLMDPAGHPYGGGSVQFLPRDFMKFGQLMLNGGMWNGRRILGREFVNRASAPLHDLKRIQYGYLWWSIAYPYKNRTVRAFFAGGNGGQGVMVIPELDLVIATYAGSFNSRVGLHIQQDFAPNYILPAVREAGDDKNAPVIQRDYATQYGIPPY
jgi:CubicO group peptidase (beta-lactamase class C family)